MHTLSKLKQFFKNSLSLAAVLLISLSFSFYVISCGGGDEPPAPTVNDKDKDGIADAIDNCPNKANKNQNDSDGDGTGDVCDDTPDGNSKYVSSYIKDLASNPASSILLT